MDSVSPTTSSVPFRRLPPREWLPKAYPAGGTCQILNQRAGHGSGAGSMPGGLADCSGACQRTIRLPAGSLDALPANSTSLRTSPAIDRADSSTVCSPSGPRQLRIGVCGVTREPWPLQRSPPHSRSGDMPSQRTSGSPDRGANTHAVACTTISTGCCSTCGARHSSNGPPSRRVTCDKLSDSGSSDRGQ